MTEEKEKLWGHDPGWWSALFGAIQLFVLTIILGSFNWLLDLHVKQARLANEIRNQKARLVQDDPQIYQPAVAALADLGRGGLAGIHEYVRDQSKKCVHWPKALLIGKTFIPGHEQDEDNNDIVAMIVKSWACSNRGFLKDAQLYEFVTERKETLCKIFSGSASDAAQGWLHVTAFIAAFRQCPKPPSEIERLASKFRAEFGPQPPCAVPPPCPMLADDRRDAYLFEPSPPTDLETVHDYTVWSGLWSGMVNLYHEAGSDADREFWREFDLDLSSLRDKLILTQLEYLSDRDNEELNTRLHSYMSRAFVSRDSATRVAGIRAVANTQWMRYQGELVRLARNDPDPSVSSQAELILGFLQAQSTWNH